MGMLQTYSAKAEDNENKLRELRRRVVILNLLNGLYLTEDQEAELIQIAEEAEIIRNNCLGQKEEQQLKARDLLAELENVLLSEGVVPDALKQQIHRMEKEQHRIEDKEFEKLLNLENQLRQILNENQILVINTYRPCLVPPEQGRIGQSVEGRGEGVMHSLERIREMPVQRYRFVKGYIADTFVERYEHRYGLIEAEEKAAYRKKVLDTFAQARTLSDKAFFLEKAGMVQSLLPEEEQVYRERRKQLGKIGRFLLDPQVKVCLTERHMAAF